MSSVELLRRLRRSHPEWPIFVSCTTGTGRQLANEKLAGLAAGVFYCPIDYCFAIRRVLRRIRPALLIVLETEIWPNLYHEIKRTGAGLIIVNGRISQRAFPSYLRHRWFFREILTLPDLILAQSPQDLAHYEKLLQLNTQPCEPPRDSSRRLLLGGNLKYDVNPNSSTIPGILQEFLRSSAPQQVWIAASTMPPSDSSDIDEDDAVIQAFQHLSSTRPGLLLILVPRRPERFDTAAQKLTTAGIPFVRRSSLPSESNPRVLLLDTIGELPGLFPLADVVFMGGTLAKRGGHNILEPAFSARPIVLGPHMGNFPEIAQRFEAASAVRRISSPQELAPAIDALLGDSVLRRQLGNRAKAAAEQERGATDTALRAIEQIYDDSLPRVVPNVFLRLVLWSLTKVWIAGGRIKRASAKTRRLEHRVVSIGGVAMGGSGKTPMVRHLANRLAARNLHPAVLTRGYKRKISEPVTILAPCAAASVDLTGDEAQLILRDGAAVIGIAADRWLAGDAIERQLHPDIFLLDDGFQHARLHRDVDVVLIDSLNPFGGWLREGLQALARADVFVITRAQPGRRYTAIRRVLAKWNPRAPVHLCSVRPRAWIELASGQARALEEFRDAASVAFCGLANPASFWTTLAAMGCHPVQQKEFPDHYRYPREVLNQLAAGAQVLLTTEKDAINLPASAASLPIYWLKMDIEIDAEDRLLNLICNRL